MKNKKLLVIQREKLMKDNPHEWCVLLGLLGFSARAIAYEIGMSTGYVYTILSKRKVSLRAYRNMESPLANYVVKQSSQVVVRNPVRLDMDSIPRLRLPQAK
jgi:hypothetical protein